MEKLSKSWLVPLEERSSSNCYNQNFLFKTGRVYVMDNHRAALWCWLRHLPADGKINLIHIDRHYDCLASQIEEWAALSTDVGELTLSEYLHRKYETELSEIGVYRWDNFLSIFLRHYRARLQGLYMAVHPRAGDKPEVSYCTIDPLDLPTTLAYYLRAESRDHALPTILDIDLDYFACRMREEEYGVMFSQDYIRAVGESLGHWARSERCLCATIALSPECCGGWSIAERILATLAESSGLELQLPAGTSEMV